MAVRRNWTIALVGIGCLLAITGLVLSVKNGVNRKTVTKNILQQKTNQPSMACNKASSGKVGDILGVSVVRIGGSFADRSKPTFISSCAYRSDSKPLRSVTIVARDAKDEAAAKTAYIAATKRSGAASVSGIGDEATYSTTSLQLTVRSGKRLVTVTVNKPTKASTIASKAAALDIAKLVL